MPAAGFEAAEKGGAHCIALNAADEVAVEAFLERRIPFTGIPGTIEKVLASTPESHPATIAEVLASDRQARQMAHALLWVSHRAPKGKARGQDFYKICISFWFPQLRLSSWLA